MECQSQEQLYFHQKQNCSLNINLQPEKIPKGKGHTNQGQGLQIQAGLHIKDIDKKCITAQQPSNTKHLAHIQRSCMLYRKHSYQGQEFTEVLDLKTHVKTIRSKVKTKYIMSSFNEVGQFGDNLVNICSIDPQNSYRSTEWKILNEETSCNCRHSQCMRNYCQCYRVNAKCSEKCSCKQCKNMNESQNEQPMGTNRQNKALNICVCKKEGNCLKSYCGCHRMGINCSKVCKCFNCKN